VTVFGYAVYIAARGELTGHYPYALVDVTEIGYRGFLTNTVGFITAFAVISVVLVLAARFQDGPSWGT